MTNNTTTVDISADCACGAVTISVKGQIWAMFLCACSDCQKISGAGHTGAAIAEPDNVKIVGDTVAFSRPADSGATLTRYFCPVCGTTIYAETSRRDDVRLLPVGLFGGADWFVPKQVVFARSHLDWDVLPNIPHYETYKQD